MARPRKEPREKFGSTLRADLYNEVKRISDDTGIPVTKLLDQAVELLLESYKIKN